MHFSKLAPAAVVLTALSGVHAGIIAYGICQTGKQRPASPM